MTLTINLPEEQDSALKAKAEAEGMSPEEYALDLLVRELGAEAAGSEPFWRSFTRRMHALPSEVFDKLPADGASEHDHYLYGSPKNNM